MNAARFDHGFVEFGKVTAFAHGDGSNGMGCGCLVDAQDHPCPLIQALNWILPIEKVEIGLHEPVRHMLQNGTQQSRLPPEFRVDGLLRNFRTRGNQAQRRAFISQFDQSGLGDCNQGPCALLDIGRAGAAGRCCSR